MILGKLAREQTFLDATNLQAHAGETHRNRNAPESPMSRNTTRVMKAVPGKAPRGRLGMLGAAAPYLGGAGVLGAVAYNRFPTTGGVNTDLTKTNPFPALPSGMETAKNWLSNPYVIGGLGVGAGALLAYLLRR